MAASTMSNTLILFIAVLLESPGRTSASYRSRKSLLNGLWWSGLRVDEANRLHWTDEAGFCVDLEGRRPKFRIQATAQKNGKFDLLPMAPEFHKMLLSIPEYDRDGYVFNLIPQRLNRTSRISTNHLSRVITEIGQKANVKTGTRKKHSQKGQPTTEVPQFAGAHDYRRAFGTRWAALVPTHVLQVMMRHANIETTMRFYVDQKSDAAADIIWAAHDEAQLGGASGGATDSRKSPELEYPTKHCEKE